MNITRRCALATLIATTLLHIAGPVLAQWALKSLADECPHATGKEF